MGRNKLGKFIILGAILGAAVSMFDRSSRAQVTRKSKDIVSGISFYSKNPDVFKWKMQEKIEKFQSVYEQISGDATYIKEQVEELKALTPQVKDLVVNTKDAFVESKDEYKSIVSDTPSQNDTSEKK